MENLKFRAWDKEDKRMKEVFNLDFHRYTAIVGFRLSEPKSFLGNDPLIIMQSTGLKDVHDNEFFDKDIARDIDSEELGLVEYFNGAFVMKFASGDGADLYDVKDNFEIIGNQYQRPHLLKE
ncbi:YopX family protein [Staphylococcus saprophyticus]|nr:YopX family protein [Staphylococcus saprophyticus]